MADGNSVIDDRTALLDQALAQAHLPSLLMSLVHITGDAGLLSDDMKPVYEFFADGRLGGYPEDRQAALRARAKQVLTAWLDGDRSLPPPPDGATLRRMMDFVAGADVPERYVPMLLEELALTGSDSRRPDWQAPVLKAAAAGLKVIVIGAGMSGILSAIRLAQAGIAFEVIEKNAEAGGTWFENTYPGCRVDNPSHLYGYSFEPNHEWPAHYSTQPVLRKYFQDCVEKYGLRSHIRFSTQVTEARFDEASKTWDVTIRKDDGTTDVLTANAVISAVGQLNQPRIPDFPGRDRFKGTAFHSACWRHDVDLKGKRVAVIGTGASAFQFVPEIAPDVGHLTVFQRTPPWLGPTPDYHDAVSSAESWLLETVPYYEKWYRFWLFWMLTDGLIDAVRSDPAYDGPASAVSAANAELREMLVQGILPQLADRPDLVEKVIPAYPIGGKRTVRDNGVWIAALKRPNVDLVTAAIAEITEAGIRTADGTLHEVDVIIYGTGFTASDFLKTLKVHGRGGVELHEQWAGDARAYLGMTIPNFPNLFVLYGPNTNIVVNGSIIFFSECSVRYVVGALQMLAETGHATLEPRRDVHDAFNARVDAANALMAWGAPQVTSWYKNAKGRVSQNWPFPLVEYWEATRKPDPADFVLD
ncbi:flavin-containing monooxygenase [Zavarzinia sp. CC-PAN008]|uniref:flavin-containing monooxygenase n=1 Tax=Zavarzinia sp. CC-PAN008 TaxID=3243332 RepID=UPI003F74891B